MDRSFERATHLRRAVALSAVSVAWSGVVGGLAAAVAAASGSLSLLGFGVDAVIDASASVALIWRFMTEVRQPERAHRIEMIAERLIGAVLIVLAAYLVVGSTSSLAARAEPERTVAGGFLLGASILVLPALAVAKYRVARRLGSGALRADSVLTGVAAILAAIALAGIAASGAGWWWADATGALVVAAIVLREGWASVTVARAAAE